MDRRSAEMETVPHSLDASSPRSKTPTDTRSSRKSSATSSARTANRMRRRRRRTGSYPKRR